MIDNELLRTWLQAGFAGFSLLLLTTVIWLIKQLITLVKSQMKVIENNTKAMTQLTDKLTTIHGGVDQLRAELRMRPCLRELSQMEDKT